jgi:dTDP-4-amino-4,6-dideoxygalactose transaminase
MGDKISVPFVDLTRQFNNLEDDLVDIFKSIGRSGKYILGDALKVFEEEFADYCGVKHAVGVANGTDALILGMKALGIGPGDEVITVPNSFISSVGAIIAVGAVPRFVDVKNDLNIDPDHVKRVITNKTKAILPVHLTGRPAEMESICEIAAHNGISVLEDAAQAIGAMYHGEKVGSLGDVGGFSLHPLKNLHIYGDGGMLTTNSTKIYEEVLILRNHGLKDRTTCVKWAMNSRLDNLQAAIASRKLKILDTLNKRFRDIAQIYKKELENIVETPKDYDHEYCVYHNFVIQVDSRDELMDYLLREHNIHTAIHYPKLIHTQPAAKSLGYVDGDFPNAEKIVERMLSLPIFPELTKDEIYKVTGAIRQFYK